MEDLLQLKANLIILNFPGLNIMNDKQISDLFSANNRLHFLTWVFEKQYPDLTLWSTPDAKSQEIADLLYENGYCTSSNKLKLVNGDKTSQDIQIFKKILHTLVITCKPDDKPTSNVLHDTQSFLNQDVNIFQDTVPLSSRTDRERGMKIAQYKKEIDSLKKEIFELEEAETLNVEFDVSGKEIDLQKIEHLENEIICFEAHLGKIYERKTSTFNIDQDNLMAVSSECHNVIRNVMQHVNDLHIISNFSESLSSIGINDEPTNNNKAIEHLLNISKEVVNMK